MKKIILGVILACSIVSCTQEGVAGKDGVNGNNGTNGTSASTANQGKTHIFITGNITNAQAATQIAQEVGSNTTHISVTNTTGLTSLDLSALTSVWEITISYNLDLATVNLNGLKSMNSLTLSYNFKLQSFSLNNVISSSYIGVNSNPIMTSLSLPQLKYGNVQIYGGMTSLTSLSTPSLTIGGAYIADTGLASLDFPLLSIVSGMFTISNNKNLKSINISNLTSISTSLNASGNSFPSTEVNKLLSLFNNKVTFTGSKNIYLFSQTPNAPPTGQGIIDKNALIAKGFSVTTD